MSISENNQSDIRTLEAEPAGRSVEQASLARDNFLISLVDELRKPLSRVEAALAILQRQPKQDIETRAYLSLIGRNVELEMRLIDDLLNLASVKRGTLELKKGPVEIQMVVNGAVEICRPELDARHINYSIDHKGPPHVVNGDGALLGRVFWNLIKNAIRFAPADGKVRVRSWADDGHVLVEVSDNGPGIDAKAIAQTFHPSENPDGIDHGNFGGLGLELGLGLALSEAVVEMHGGKIEVFSEGTDRGARFTVRLPIARPAHVSSLPSGDGDGDGDGTAYQRI